MVQIKYILLTLALLLPITANAHSNILLDIDLDFDLELKDNIIKTAQKYLNTDSEPIGFEYDSELIIVKFNEYPIRSVVINPFEYSIFGEEDRSKVGNSGNLATTSEERKASAQNIFLKIPQSYQQEMKYGEEREERNMFTHTWYRYKDNIVVPKERLEVIIDGENGKVISWKLQIFQSQKELLETVPAISADIAENIGELLFDAKNLDFEPILIIHDSELVWVTKMKVLYPIYIGISAKDGKVLFTGGMKGILPEKYSTGSKVSVVETSLIKKIYEEY